MNKEDIQYYKSLTWTFQNWKPSPALIDKSGFPSHQYIGQNFDAAFFSIDPQGWTHDHCEICSKPLCENQVECDTNGFISGNHWLCVSCFHSYIKES